MKITTKFNLGDTVYGNFISKSETKEVICPVCRGTGRVKLEGLDRTTVCPDCFVLGNVYIDEPCCKITPFHGRIGKIELELYIDEPFAGRFQGVNEYKYMIDSHGIGSGTLFKEEELFATEAEADAYSKEVEAKWIKDQLTERRDGKKTFD